MVGAHSRPPNTLVTTATNKQRGRDKVCLSASPHPSGRTHNRKCSPNRIHFLQDNNPIVLHSHGLPSNKPATQQDGTTPRPMTSEQQD
ncbi:hypothetical protein E2C01_086998 [Portunus trituberculatus]|uniref:Uncharacterized protein n=1 Tax=Portunus trituberculatus TaxID=210409 RepID=A0A5B7JC56_PORTR|nr:hypothetical protein [Portunus trituberculatus]